jgi:DNA-directed RNA polymerase subunit RPC12/RpoP
MRMFEPVICQKCGGKTFAVYRTDLDAFDFVCVGCDKRIESQNDL